MSERPNEIEWNRAAAWWAGEGSVEYKDRKLAVTVAQKELDVLIWFQSKFGGTVSTRKRSKPHLDPTSEWKLFGAKAYVWLLQIRDLIPESPRRQRQIDAALVTCAGRKKTGPAPSLICKRGHEKDANGRCRECGKIWRHTYFSNEKNIQKKREREKARYWEKPEYYKEKRRRYKEASRA